MNKKSLPYDLICATDKNVVIGFEVRKDNPPDKLQREPFIKMLGCNIDKIKDIFAKKSFKYSTPIFIAAHNLTQLVRHA